MKTSITLVVVLLSGLAYGDAIRQTKGEHYDAFRQLDVDLPTANVYRTASGAPGPQYWQQRADYKIDVRLDERPTPDQRFRDDQLHQSVAGHTALHLAATRPEPICRRFGRALVRNSRMPGRVADKEERDVLTYRNWPEPVLHRLPTVTRSCASPTHAVVTCPTRSSTR